eukprot:scaffold184903_cov30-Tisochrysis_lutea.AAC.5
MTPNMWHVGRLHFLTVLQSARIKPPWGLTSSRTSEFDRYSVGSSVATSLSCRHHSSFSS